MCKKFAKSAFDFLPAPSAMFVGMEYADRLICDDNPKVSYCGKLSTVL